MLEISKFQCTCIFSFFDRDEGKQEEMWKLTFEMIGKYLTEEELAGMKGT